MFSPQILYHTLSLPFSLEVEGIGSESSHTTSIARCIISFVCYIVTMAVFEKILTCQTVFQNTIPFYFVCVGPSAFACVDEAEILTKLLGLFTL